jgi:methyl-accepting chemotaxis protein
MSSYSQQTQDTQQDNRSPYAANPLPPYLSGQEAMPSYISQNRNLPPKAGGAHTMDVDAQSRLAYLELTPDSVSYLQEFRVLLEANFTRIIDGFYNHAGAYPNLKTMFGSDANIARLKKAQGDHWMSLFEGHFGADYLNKVKTVGAVHKMQGLEPRWYLGGYCYVMNALVDLAASQYGDQPEKFKKMMQTVNKALFLDIDLVISIYFGTILGDIKENSDFVREASGRLNATSSEMNDTATELGNLANNTAHVTEQLDSNIKNVAAAVEEATANIQTVFRASESVSQNLNVVSDQSNEITNTMQHFATSVETMSSSVNTVAAAVAEMSASLNEVSQSATQAANVASKAEGAAEETKQTVDKLGKSAKEIDNVVEMIKNIAAQTNLLALNATIEAASAGEAGKGFAVVANEVKALAKQSAEATINIKNQIEEMQSNTDAAVGSIKEIIGTIGEMNRINNTIASAVEEQTATANEISRSVSGAAQSANEISSNVQTTVKSVEQVASQVDQAGKGVLEITRNLDELSKGSNEIAKSAQEAASGATTMSQSVSKLNDSAVKTKASVDMVKESAGQLELLPDKLEKLVNQFKS